MKKWVYNESAIYVEDGCPIDEEIDFSPYEKSPKEIWLKVMVDALNVYEKTGLLASQVEQATLERVAKIAETCDLYEGDYLRNSDPRKTIAHEIRAEMYD